MKTFLNLWEYRTEFFLEWEIFQIKVAEKIKTPILFFYVFCTVRAEHVIRSKLPTFMHNVVLFGLVSV